MQDRQLLVNGLAAQALAGAVHLLCIHLARTAYVSLSSLQNKGSTSSSIVAFGRNERLVSADPCLSSDKFPPPKCQY
ncbi:hypothetical protein EEQ99_09615 [Rhizobium anhuiense]|uniref:Uncharacterized protein n=1 Tax=Rhizobium anhuiense TaxID=1184720 RepID=A0A3S0QCQ5_9HYPH|nr:hypothetical protein EEQ99_09615 [Rhizobium anhuiense]